MKAEGAGKALLRRFGGETVTSCTKYDFKILNIPDFISLADILYLEKAGIRHE
jgi:hypothetical protein